MARKTGLITVIILIFLWHLMAAAVGNDILIPYPAQVGSYLLGLLRSEVLYTSVLMTTLRVAKGFLISMVCAMIFSILSDYSPVMRSIFTPIHVLTKTIPNASYIIIAIIWLGSEGAASAVSFMILFPVFYNSFINAMDQEDASLKDVGLIYRESFFGKLRYRTMPLILTEILTTGKTAASMGFKVGVMAEVIGQVKVGIGRQMSYARLYLQTDRLIAWTAVIIIISILLDQLFDLLILYRKKEEQRWRN